MFSDGNGGGIGRVRGASAFVLTNTMSDAPVQMFVKLASGATVQRVDGAQRVQRPRSSSTRKRFSTSSRQFSFSLPPLAAGMPPRVYQFHPAFNRSLKCLSHVQD